MLGSRVDLTCEEGLGCWYVVGFIEYRELDGLDIHPEQKQAPQKYQSCLNRRFVNQKLKTFLVLAEVISVRSSSEMFLTSASLAAVYLTM